MANPPYDQRNSCQWNNSKFLRCTPDQNITNIGQFDSLGGYSQNERGVSEANFYTRHRAGVLAEKYALITCTIPGVVIGNVSDNVNAGVGTLTWYPDTLTFRFFPAGGQGELIGAYTPTSFTRIQRLASLTEPNTEMYISIYEPTDLPLVQTSDTNVTVLATAPSQLFRPFSDIELVEGGSISQVLVSHSVANRVTTSTNPAAYTYFGCNHEGNNNNDNAIIRFAGTFGDDLTLQVTQTTVLGVTMYEDDYNDILYHASGQNQDSTVLGTSPPSVTITSADFPDNAYFHLNQTMIYENFGIVLVLKMTVAPGATALGASHNLMMGWSPNDTEHVGVNERGLYFLDTPSITRESLANPDGIPL